MPWPHPATFGRNFASSFTESRVASQSVLKDAPAPELANAIRSVAAGRRVLDPELVAAAVDTGSSPLTDREADVLRAAESGLSTEEIGERLNLSAATVRNYLSNAIGKLGARNRLDAIRIAGDAGWL